MSNFKPTENEATETSPLLSQPEDTVQSNESRLLKRPLWQSPQNLQILLIGVVLFAQFGEQLMEGPQTRINESVICYRYYEKVDPSKLLARRETVGPGAIGGVAEIYCKADEVQSDLAFLRGWQNLLYGFPALMLAVPFGWAADKYGRKIVVAAGLTAFVLRTAWIQVVTWYWQYFDIRMTWLSTIFSSIGGGDTVTSSMFYVTMSDVTTDAERATIFMRANAFNMLGNVIMPPIAAPLMEINPWIPSLGGTLFFGIALALFLVCPETKNFLTLQQDQTTSTLNMTDEPAEAPEGEGPTESSLLLRWYNNVKKSIAFITGDWRIAALVVPFLIHNLVGTISQLLLQYLSKRYALKFSKAILIATVRMVVIVLLLFIILPYISTYLMRVFRLSPQRKDLYLARASYLFFAIGWVLVGLSPNVPMAIISLAISSLGFGSAVLLRSFVTYLVPNHHIARLYSAISIVDTSGTMFGSPLLAGLFKRGLALGGAWIGLPFYFLGISSAISALLLSAVRLRKGEDDCTESDPEE